MRKGSKFYLTRMWHYERVQIIDSTFNYRRLSQMKADCEYFLGAGNRKNKHLWEASIGNTAQFTHKREENW